MIVGILGSGQLAQLLALKAASCGVKTLCFSDTHHAPAAKTSQLFIGDLQNPDDLCTFAKHVDIITLENENISTDTIDLLSQHVPVYPDKKALYYAQDRLHEKTLFNTLNINTPLFYAIDTHDDIQPAIDKVGLPAILKTRRLGYDGKGQFQIASADDIQDALTICAGQSLILEERIDFAYEVSILAAQNTKGERIFYPLIKNEHTYGILRTSTCPIHAPDLQQQAQAYSEKLMSHLHYTGLLALELFVREGKLLANEIAPRVHNSGHLTIEGCNVSQFTSHLQAILGHAMTTPKAKMCAMMVNIIGQFPEQLFSLNTPGITLYDYGKSAKKNRKLGHITMVDQNEHITLEKMQTVQKCLPGLAVKL